MNRMILVDITCISPAIPLSVVILVCTSSTSASFHSSKSLKKNKNDDTNAESLHRSDETILTLTKKTSSEFEESPGQYVPHDSTLIVRAKPQKETISILSDSPIPNRRTSAALGNEDARIKIYPKQVTTFEGSKTAFSCIVTEGLATTIEWLVNGTPIKDFHVADVEMGTIQTAGNLVFKHIPASFNDSDIQCRVQFSDSQSFSYSARVHLLIQGKLDIIQGLKYSYIRGMKSYKFNWSNPSTLNIPVFQNNISFCIEIDTSNSFAKVCKKEPGFVLSQVDPATEYQVNITAVNGAGRGKTATVKLPGEPNIVSISAILTPPPIKHLIALSDAVASCNAALANNTQMFLECNKGSGTMEVFSRDFKYNQKFNVTVHFFNSRHKQSATLTLSSFDVQDIFLDTAQNEVYFAIKFANNSEARGMLIIFQYKGSTGPDITHSKYIILGKEKAAAGNTLEKMSGGKYVVMVFDIESDGLIQSAFPALETYVDVPGGKQYGNAFQEFHTKALCAAFNSSMNRSIEVSCQLDTSLFVGFVVLTQHIIPPYDRLGDIVIKYSESIHHPVTVKGTGNGSYLVTVLPLSGSTNLIGSSAIFKAKVHLNGFISPIHLTTSIKTEVASSAATNTTDEDRGFKNIHIIAIVASIFALGVCISAEILLVITYMKVKTNILRVTKVNTTPLETGGHKSFQGCTCAGIRVNSLCTVCTKSHQTSNSQVPDVFHSGPAPVTQDLHTLSEFKGTNIPISSTLLNVEGQPNGQPYRPLHNMHHTLPEIDLSSISPHPREKLDSPDKKMKMTYVYAKVKRPKKRPSLWEISCKEQDKGIPLVKSESTFVYSSKSTNQSASLNHGNNLDHIENDMQNMLEGVPEHFRSSRQRCNCREESHDSSRGTDSSEDRCDCQVTSKNRAMVVSALKDMGLDNLAKEYSFKYSPRHKSSNGH